MVGKRIKILKLPEPENKELLGKISTINGTFPEGDLIIDKKGYIFQIVKISFPSIRLKTITPNPYFNKEDNFKLYGHKHGEDFRQFTNRVFPMLLLHPTDNLLTRLEEMGMLTY